MNVGAMTLAELNQPDQPDDSGTSVFAAISP